MGMAAQKGASGVTFGSAFTPLPPPALIDMRLTSLACERYCEMGVVPAAFALNSRVKRERPKSPLTPLIR